MFTFDPLALALGSSEQAGERDRQSERSPEFVTNGESFSFCRFRAQVVGLLRAGSLAGIAIAATAQLGREGESERQLIICCTISSEQAARALRLHSRAPSDLAAMRSRPLEVP